MMLCDDGHAEVCYEARNCPACEALADKDKEILGLEQKIENMEIEMDRLNEEDQTHGERSHSN